LAAPTLAGDGGWQAGAGNFDEAAQDQLIRQSRAVVKKRPRDPKARDGLADAAVALAIASEVARVLGDTETAERYIQTIRQQLPDTMWRVDYRAGKGDPRAQVALGVFRERGVVLERDRALACDAWQKAAAGDNALGQYRAALCTAGNDDRLGSGLMRAAAEQGHPAAQYEQAEVCMASSPPDTGCAARWAAQAAMQGLVAAQGLIGWLHFSGQATGLSDAQALGFLEVAAASGDLATRNNLGQVLESGAGGDARKPEAARWYALAAGEGFAPAQYNLGRLHVIGLGVEESIPQARRWLTLAENGGVAQAGEMLAWLSARETTNGDVSAKRESPSALPAGDGMAAPGETTPRGAR
jgi:TPR repeat protein